MAKRFAYKALASDGAAVQGEMDAPDAATVIDNLQASDFLPISTDELVESHYANDFRLWSRRRVTRHDVHNFTRELATMLSAGLPLSHALETLTSLTDRPATADLFERIRANVEAGNSLSASLEQSGGVHDESLRRRPWCNVNHVAAKHGVGARNRPVQLERIEIERRGDVAEPVRLDMRGDRAARFGIRIAWLPRQMT